jgi:hypothetical protein
MFSSPQSYLFVPRSDLGFIYSFFLLPDFLWCVSKKYDPNVMPGGSCGIAMITSISSDHIYICDPPVLWVSLLSPAGSHDTILHPVSGSSFPFLISVLPSGSLPHIR